MPIFISHVTLTLEGVKALKDLPGRIEDNKKLWAECGGKILRWDVVLGDYDYLVVSEAPDEKVMAEIAIKASRRGRTSFKTFSAIPVEEFASVAQRL